MVPGSVLKLAPIGRSNDSPPIFRMSRETELRDRRVEGLAWALAMSLGFDGSNERRVNSHLWIVEEAFSEVGLWVEGKEDDSVMVIGPMGFAEIGEGRPRWAQSSPSSLDGVEFGYVTGDSRWIVGVSSERNSRVTLRGPSERDLATDAFGSFVFPRPDGLAVSTNWEMLSMAGRTIGVGGFF
jgi:hypothetical protein